MYIDMLKELYYEERKKLEEMWIYKQEAKLRFLKLRSNIIDRIEGRLTPDEISGRNDINEEVKDNLLRDREKGQHVEEQIAKNLKNDRETIEDDENEEVESANYAASDYGDYLYQLEKVFALEDALSEERLFPEQIYEEMCERKRSV